MIFIDRLIKVIFAVDYVVIIIAFHVLIRYSDVFVLYSHLTVLSLRTGTVGRVMSSWLGHVRLFGGI